MNNEPDPRGKSRSGRGFRQRRMQMAAGAIFSDPALPKCESPVGGSSALYVKVERGKKMINQNITEKTTMREDPVGRVRDSVLKSKSRRCCCFNRRKKERDREKENLGFIFIFMRSLEFMNAQ